MFHSLKHSTKQLLSPAVACAIKRGGIYLRYSVQAHRCRVGFREFGDQYPQEVLFIAGLPKSGSTWLKKMITSYPGYNEILIPDTFSHALTTGGSHNYELPNDIFSRLKDMLAVTRMHIHGSPHNVEVLRNAGIRYVVLYRDLRDVAVSYYFYVSQTPWHPEYGLYRELSVQEGLATFAVGMLSDYARWIRSWHENRDKALSLEITYEWMLSDTPAAMRRIAEHFELDSSASTIERIVKTHSFQRLSGGRGQGEESRNSFFRKGVAGDWKNYFTPELKEKYKQTVGDLLIEFGYEQDWSW